MSYVNDQPSIPVLGYSEDGYIRLTFQHFFSLRFAQRTMIDDGELCAELLERDIPAFAAGYCEWLDVSATAQVSVGWAWFVTTSDAPALLAPGGFSSNVMITSADDRDLGPVRTEELLDAWLSGQTWQHRHAPMRSDIWPSNLLLLH